MSYGQGVLQRLLNPGALLVLAGAVLVYDTKRLTAKVSEENQYRVSVALKAVGCALVLLGALMVLRS